MKNKTAMPLDKALELLQSHSDPENVEGMARFGIAVENVLGVSMPDIRKIARTIGKNHDLAISLWDTGIHDARILSSCVDEPDKVTGAQCEKMVRDFKSWDLCDQTCKNLFNDLSFAEEKIYKWRSSREEFIKRAAFALICEFAVHRKKMENEKFEAFLELVIEASSDERNFVKKAVNWALRQIGKRNKYLHAKAIETAEKIKNLPYKSAKWIASGAIRELHEPKIIARIK